MWVRVWRWCRRFHLCVYVSESERVWVYVTLFKGIWGGLARCHTKSKKNQQWLVVDWEAEGVCSCCNLSLASYFDYFYIHTFRVCVLCVSHLTQINWDVYVLVWHNICFFRSLCEYTSPLPSSPFSAGMHTHTLINIDSFTVVFLCVFCWVSITLLSTHRHIDWILSQLSFFGCVFVFCGCYCFCCLSAAWKLHNSVFVCVFFRAHRLIHILML